MAICDSAVPKNVCSQSFGGSIDFSCSFSFFPRFVVSAAVLFSDREIVPVPPQPCAFISAMPDRNACVALGSFASLRGTCLSTGIIVSGYCWTSRTIAVARKAAKVAGDRGVGEGLRWVFGANNASGTIPAIVLLSAPLSTWGRGRGRG